MLQLTSEQTEELARLMRTAAKPHVRVKATALWSLAQGRTPGEVAAVLGVSRGSVGRWARRFREEGVAGLAIRPGRGRPLEADLEDVARTLEQSPRAFGLPQTRWTLAALGATVPSLRGFSGAGVWKVLRRLGYHYKRGQPRLTSPDPQYAEKRGRWFKPSARPLPARAR